MSITFGFSGGEEHDELNLANGNAWDVLDALGFEADHSGTIEASELAQRCLVFLNTEQNDAAIPAFEGRGTLGANVVYCGRRPGYLHEKVRILQRIAINAKKAGKPVTFG